MPGNDSATVTVAAKLSLSSASGLAALAALRGMTRSQIIRELVEATLEERFTLPTKEELIERDLVRNRTLLREDLRQSAEFKQRIQPGSRQWDVQTLYERERARRHQSSKPVPPSKKPSQR